MYGKRLNYLALLALISLGASSVNATTCTIPSDDAEVRMAAGLTYQYEFEGTIYEREADIFAPKPESQTAPCPIVVMLPAGCNKRKSLSWAPPMLASRGFIVISPDIQAREVSQEINAQKNAAICVAAASSAIDFMLSAGNPYLTDSNTDRIGAIGVSRGASSLTLLQDVDERLNAIVAWDNLAKSETGDAGSPACKNVPETERFPKAPALGIASEECDVATQPGGAAAKTTAWRHWRNFGVPSMELVMAGYPHTAFSKGYASHKAFIMYYTSNWLDRFLKDEIRATRLLMSRYVDPGNDIDPSLLRDLLSKDWRSAAFIDGYDCDNLRRPCIAGPAAP